jgi:hypothetical protein
MPEARYRGGRGLLTAPAGDRALRQDQGPDLAG